MWHQLKSFIAECTKMQWITMQSLCLLDFLWLKNKVVQLQSLKPPRLDWLYKTSFTRIKLTYIAAGVAGAPSCGQKGNLLQLSRITEFYRLTLLFTLHKSIVWPQTLILSMSAHSIQSFNPESNHPNKGKDAVGGSGVALVPC